MIRYDLSGRNAIVTGGAGGIGIAIARHYLAAGANVELWDAKPDPLAGAAKGLGASGQVFTRVVDVTQDEAVAEAAEACARERKRIDILVNNAGILGEVKPIWETTPANFRRVMEVNLVGAYLATRAVVGLMRKQEARPHRGHVVNIASVQGKEGMANAAAYAASKAALMALTKVVAKETAKEGIIVTCITPSAADTAMAKEMTDARRADILSRIPMGRFVEVDEIARLVLWLSSEDCSFSTGAAFDISGGRSTY